MRLFKKKNLLFSVYILLIFPFCLEIALWILQYRPYHQQTYEIVSKPSFCLIPDKKLGFALHPGSFRVQINAAPPYQATHGKDSLRICSYKDLKNKAPQIFLMGCSYTYGMGIDDSLSFPFLLQGEFKQYNIRNFGVPGFGTTQSYLQLLSQLEQGNIPKFLIINFADFHLDRNVLSPGFRKDLFMGFARSNPQVKQYVQQAKIPYLADDFSNKSISWCSWNLVYQNWPGRETFASVNFFQEFADRINDNSLRKEKLTLELFKTIQSLCQENNIELLVTGLTKGSKTMAVLSQLSSLGISTLDISVDLSDSTFTQLPHDSHPNSSAHRHYFKKIYSYLAPRLEAHILTIRSSADANSREI